MRSEYGVRSGSSADARSTARARWRRISRSAWAVAALVGLCYGLWLAAVVPVSNGGLDFVEIGQHYIARSHASPTIALDPSYWRQPARLPALEGANSKNAVGYDGQFYYYIALDPRDARYYMDNAVYRYTRVVYPLAARLLALGQPSLIPYTLIAVNWLAIVAGTLAVAAWLKRRRLSPWLALVYGFYPGLFIALRFDLTEALSYAFVALAVLLLDGDRPWRAVWSGLAFALAALTRETAIIFPVVYGLALLKRPAPDSTRNQSIARGHGHGRVAAFALLGLALIPFALYQGFLRVWLRSLSGQQPVSSLTLRPFGGLIAARPWHVIQKQEVLTTVVPAILCTGIGLWTLWRGVGSAEVWALLANVYVGVVMVTVLSYDALFATDRVATGVALAALYCLPTFDRALRGNRRWLWVCGALWLALVPLWLVNGVALNWLHAFHHSVLRPLG